jgi:pSer/pThr/pTyr-binding forkhead associated (FHA) protein
MRLAELVPWVFHICQEPPLVKLRLYQPGYDAKIVAIEDLPVTIGRSDDMNIRVCDHWVSRVHCCLRAVDGRLVIRDLESLHGTIVNGEAVKERELSEGDTIYIGMTEIQILQISESDALFSVAKPR